MSDSASDPQLLETPWGRFLEQVSDPDATPAAGSVAAIAVAMAAGLCVLAARLSTRQMPDALGITDEALGLRDRAAALCQRDADAYDLVLVAMRRPRDLDPEDRRRAITRALSESTDVLVELAGIAARVAALATYLAESGNPRLRDDAITAALFAESALRSVAAMVGANLDSASDDDRRSRVASLLDEASSCVARVQRPTGG